MSKNGLCVEFCRLRDESGEFAEIWRRCGSQTRAPAFSVDGTRLRRSPLGELFAGWPLTAALCRKGERDSSAGGKINSMEYQESAFRLGAHDLRQKYPCRKWGCGIKQRRALS